MVQNLFSHSPFHPSTIPLFYYSKMRTAAETTIKKPFQGLVKSCTESGGSKIRYLERPKKIKKAKMRIAVTTTHRQRLASCS